MNWGKGIIIAMALFIGFITFLVVNIMSQKVDLVSEDYYKREINYEQEIIEQNNSNALKERVALLSQEDFVVVQIPSNGYFTNVEIQFVRPDDEKSDQNFLIKGTKSYLIPKAKFKKGKYNVEVRYVVDKKQCLQKESITI
jgi:hypothetical protein